MATEKTKANEADTKSSESAKSKKVEGDLADPMATAPSNDPNKAERADMSTAAEPNSAQRMAERRASRTGRNNGGSDGDAARNGLRAGIQDDRSAPTTLGEREAVSPADTDVIWTNSSKDRWGVDQPSMGAQLKQQRKIQADRDKREK